MPFFERLFRSRLAAIIVAGFICGLRPRHLSEPGPSTSAAWRSAWPGVLLGFLLFRFGLLPLLIWHYTVDALYTALLLFRSGNRYYVVSAGLASLVFAIPMVLSIVAYIRNKGFIPDDDLTNATLPTSSTPAAVAEAEVVCTAEPIPVAGGRIVLCLVALAIAVGLASARQRGWKRSSTTASRASRPSTRRWAGSRQRSTASRWRSASPSPTKASGRGAKRADGRGRLAGRLRLHRRAIPGAARHAGARHRGRNAAAGEGGHVPRAHLHADCRSASTGWKSTRARRKSSAINRLQDEKMPGPRLEQPQAQAVALAAFPTYGYDASHSR